MHIGRNILARKGKYFFGLIFLLSVAAVCAAFNMTDSDDFAIERREILLRKIGHELLLQSGDSTSRVLPIKIISENKYQISFENELTFKADSLVNTTQRLLAKEPLAGDYLVTVFNSGNSGIAYGYAISKNKKDNIIPCIGRTHPRAHYNINIKFKPTNINIVRNGYLLGSVPFLAFISFIFLRSIRPHGAPLNDRRSRMLTFGSVLFNTLERQLIINKKTINLTGTETRMLIIFALAPNQIIERSRLQKDIWEDEGIIVGRSLDMFISKLRKKLELDPNINIVVIRGKGYKLEIT